VLTLYICPNVPGFILFKIVTFSILSIFSLVVLTSSVIILRSIVFEYSITYEIIFNELISYNLKVFKSDLENCSFLYLA